MASPSSLLPLLLVSFLALLAPSLPAPPPTSSTLLQTTCSLTSDYDSCMSALQGDPRSQKATDVQSLSLVAVRIALGKAKSASKYAAGLVANANSTADDGAAPGGSSAATAAATALKGCADKYSYAGEALRSALQSLGEENYDYASVNVGAAQEYASACGRLLQRNGGVAAYPAALAKREDDLERLCATAMDIISQLG